jgi:hypothetical protein
MGNTLLILIKCKFTIEANTGSFSMTEENIRLRQVDDLEYNKLFLKIVLY